MKKYHRYKKQIHLSTPYRGIYNNRCNFTSTFHQSTYPNTILTGVASLNGLEGGVYINARSLDVAFVLDDDGADFFGVATLLVSKASHLVFLGVELDLLGVLREGERESLTGVGGRLLGDLSLEITL